MLGGFAMAPHRLRVLVLFYLNRTSQEVSEIIARLKMKKHIEYALLERTARVSHYTVYRRQRSLSVKNCFSRALSGPEKEPIRQKQPKR